MRRSNVLLIFGLCTGSLQQIFVFCDLCYEKDTAPVELDVQFNVDCRDLEGNIYRLGSELRSCCDCLRFQKS